jgi:hypothetical protein
MKQIGNIREKGMKGQKCCGLARLKARDFSPGAAENERGSVRQRKVGAGMRVGALPASAKEFLSLH